MAELGVDAVTLKLKPQLLSAMGQRVCGRIDGSPEFQEVAVLLCMCVGGQ